jgi:hypothetical protein
MKMSRDRISVIFPRTSGEQPYLRILDKIVLLTDDECELIRQGVRIYMRPSQFARFIALHDELNVSNFTKDLQIKWHRPGGPHGDINFRDYVYLDCPEQSKSVYDISISPGVEVSPDFCEMVIQKVLMPSFAINYAQARDLMENGGVVRATTVQIAILFTALTQLNILRDAANLVTFMGASAPIMETVDISRKAARYV